ncbi:MAG: hypothetical protein ACW9W3_00070 [Candidatus Nitrosopumilus sp. bin_68KS]
MVKENKKKEGKPKKNDFKSFLKKRAPIYLALIAMFIIFVIPELTKGDLESSFPELTSEEKQVLDILMNYNGPNGLGLTVMDAITNNINEEYSNEKIFDHKKTVVDLTISKINGEEYNIILNFKSYKGELNYDWNIDKSLEKITSNNQDSKHIIDLVDFYD